MNILDALKQLRDDIKIWATNNFNALNTKIDEKTIPIDNKLDSSSINPVQNKVVANAINNIPRFSGDYNDLTNAPNIAEDESGNMVITDEAGNIIFSVDTDGAHTTSLSLNGQSVEDIIDTRVASLVDSAPETLNTLNELASALGDDPNFATTVATQIGGKVDKVDGKSLSTNDFTNEYKDALDNLSSMTFEETDPTVPAWAKKANKPTYTAEEVGALSKDTELFSGDYNDLENAPNITEDNNGNLIIADNNGNIIFRSDANGFETTQLITDVLVVNGKNMNATINSKQDKIMGTAGQFVVIGDDGNATTMSLNIAEEVSY